MSLPARAAALPEEPSREGTSDDCRVPARRSRARRRSSPASSCRGSGARRRRSSATTRCSTCRASRRRCRACSSSTTRSRAIAAAARVAADRRSRRGARQLVGARARRREAVAPRAVRPAGDQGERRHVRLEHARARDRGAGARRPGEGRGGAQIDRRGHRRQSLGGEAGLAGGRAAEGRADRAARVVAVPRGRHRSGCRDLHEVAADVGDRHRRRHRPASEVRVEQPRARDRSRREQPRAHGRRDARQRRQPARLRGSQRAAARQGEGQQRVLRDRPVHPPVRRALRHRRRAPVRARDAGRRSRGLRARRRELDVADQPRPARSRRARDRAESPVSRRPRALSWYDVRADAGSTRARRGIHARDRRHRHREDAAPRRARQSRRPLRPDRAVDVRRRGAHAQSRARADCSLRRRARSPNPTEGIRWPPAPFATSSPASGSPARPRRSTGIRPI